MSVSLCVLSLLQFSDDWEVFSYHSSAANSGVCVCVCVCVRACACVCVRACVCVCVCV